MAIAPQFEGKNLIVFSRFDGMNTQAQRHDLPEQKAAWMENLQPIGPNNILCTPAASSAIASLSAEGETITKMFYFNFGQSSDYVICFCQSGSAYSIANPAGTKVKFANSGTFSTSPDVTNWETQRILIADATAGYCTYDTVVFVKYGGVSPNIEVTAGGSGYNSGATVSITGGSGSGATATATVVGGVVTGIVLTAAGTGYVASDTLTVSITPVSGGSGATASAHVWPQVTPNPTTIAVYSGRVWLAQTNLITYTGTGAAYGGVGYDDFKSADASGTTTIQDADLTHVITALRALNNYLFIIGDASVKQIGNISVSSSTTNFTVTTLSSDQGTVYRESIVSFNRLVLFANTVGVFAVFGSSVEKISDDMDGIFRDTDFTQQPCAAVADINNIHCYLLLVRYKDAVNGTRSLILTFANKKWFAISQGNSLKFIVTGIVSSVYKAYGTSGSDITPLLADSSTAVDVTLATPLSSNKTPIIGKRMGRWATAQSVGNSSTLELKLESENPTSVTANYNISNILTFINNSGGTLTFVNNGGGALSFITSAAGFFYKSGNSGGINGIYLGATLTGNVINFTLNAFMFDYQEAGAYGTQQIAYGTSP